MHAARRAASKPREAFHAVGKQQVQRGRGMDTMKFDPTTLTARAGQPIQGMLDDGSGQIAHDFDITEGVPQPIKISAQPGQKATGTFTIDKPGETSPVLVEANRTQVGDA